MENIYTEAVEVCPYCESENSYPNWDVEKQGFIVKCQECGKQIFLCDECLHADGNPGGNCDWRETENGRKCFRGEIKNDYY